jgi:protein-L-isoaspartate(D-aspartate) O-methyltransferase
MEPQRQRDNMVRYQIASRGITDEEVLRAFREVPREMFVPEELREFAYEDNPLPIGANQTISQPYIVALMTEALELTPPSRVLDIGTGSGYGAAILSRIAAEVFTVERIGSLAREAEVRLRRLGYENVHVREGDGSLGWAEHAPYDAIVVAAGGPEIPPHLLDQLAEGGRLVMPVGDTPRLQRLLRIRRCGEEIRQENLADVRFVPLIGEEGWREDGRPARTVREPRKGKDPIGD